MLANAHRLPDDGRRGPMIVLAVEDITERKQAEELLRRQLDFTRAITASLGEGVYALDERGASSS